MFAEQKSNSDPEGQKCWCNQNYFRVYDKKDKFYILPFFSFPFLHFLPLTIININPGFLSVALISTLGRG